MSFKLPELRYKHSDLEPFIDTKTMLVHHTVHHKGYVDKLNEALEKYPEFLSKPIEGLLIELGDLPKEIQTPVRNFGGGHFNHSLLWNILGPKSERNPGGEFGAAIEEQLGGVDQFKKDFTKQAIDVFGSGYTWLCVNSSEELVIINTENQDCPLTRGLKPIFCADLWEHAYYLKHQSERQNYLQDIWSIVNWKCVENLWSRYLKNIKAASGHELRRASA